ncbi:hypothetical protein [Actinacidiphila acidipaludis]|uniref:Small CPxCG-related zinc finger protein n=1 Tax=Actinacidiphila acidipaludis TaxID=2873382 RepID=A0ABS7QB07_9ACTN|nr:hypothetical protein [Streptomyces acidipaludis]MBY8880311.1 hypothetical protein [Streptomyces acidipaludis]
MNGYAAVAEIDVDHSETSGDAPGREQYGTVHAARLDDAGLPEHVTLCDMSTDELRLMSGDIPTDESDTWYPPGDHVTKVCPDCDKLVQRG